MAIELGSLKYPELVFGIAGPIGIDIDGITRALADTLRAVGYRSALIKLTQEIADIPSGVTLPVNETFYNLMRYKMAHASELCREAKDPAYLMRIVIKAIKRVRAELISVDDILTNQDDTERSVVAEDIPADTITPFDRLSPEDQSVAYRSAYIIRQIKRPQEVEFLRRVYGKQFVLISAYGSEKDRIEILKERIRLDSSSGSSLAREAFFAAKLVELDASEEGDTFGQHTRDAFHLADVVIDGIHKPSMMTSLERFTNALFGSNEIAPTKAELGMYAAYTASLRSTDLSRQVGAAVFSPTGEVRAQGCNEVPKAGGGNYWDGDASDYRDIKLGKDSNDVLKVDVLRDLVDRLKKGGLLSEKASKAGSPAQIVNFLIGRGVTSPELEDIRGSLANAKIMDLTEYGRAVHAEMNAICDAARMGVALKGSHLYTTTFPCHNCTKHIIASGIERVVFLEPYPKSKAKDLHDNEIEIESDLTDKVSFNSFIGIAPRRYSAIFQKTKRKRHGLAVKWMFGGPAPIVEVLTDDYLRLENFVTADLEA